MVVSVVTLVGGVSQPLPPYQFTVAQPSAALQPVTAMPPWQ